MRPIALPALFVLTGIASYAGAQNPGTNASMGEPMGERPAPDTTRMQQEMELKEAIGPLKLSFGKKHAEFTAQALTALPQTSLKLYNEHAKTEQVYSGVPLIELLKPLGIHDKLQGKDFRLYIVAQGSDGYQVVYSLAEAIPDLHDSTVLVADSLDGKPIGDEGPIQLVASGEKNTARWVRNLVAVRVMTAP